MPISSSNADAVVLVGGGFGCLTAAFALRSRDPLAKIILIEPRSRFVFFPLLYELLSGELQTWEVAPTYKSLLTQSDIIYLQDLVENIDIESQRIDTKSGLSIGYSSLVIGTGSETEDFGIPGVLEHSLTFRSLEDVDRILNLIKQLNSSFMEQRRLVIVGGGLSGVELCCKLSDLLGNKIKIHLIELSKTILPHSRSFNREQAHRALRQRGVEIYLSTRVVSVTQNQVHLQAIRPEEKSFALSFESLIWTAGSRPLCPDFLSDRFCKGKRIPINDYLQVAGSDNIYAIGDVARNIKDPLPQTAQVAVQQGELIARNLSAIREDRSPKPFDFKDLGEMLSLGIGDASLTTLGFTLKGPLAFQIRRIAYLGRMPGLFLRLKSAGAWILKS